MRTPCVRIPARSSASVIVLVEIEFPETFMLNVADEASYWTLWTSTIATDANSLFAAATRSAVPEYSTTVVLNSFTLFDADGC